MSSGLRLRIRAGNSTSTNFKETKFVLACSPNSFQTEILMMLNQPGKGLSLELVLDFD